MYHNNKNGNVKLSEILEYGQGYDDVIVELFKNFQKFRDGYYGLINYGDDWWKNFNQSTWFDKTMQEQWKQIEDIDFMTVIDTMAMAMAGEYVNFDKFVNGVIDAYENGGGFRHKEGNTDE